MLKEIFSQLNVKITTIILGKWLDLVMWAEVEVRKLIGSALILSHSDQVVKKFLTKNCCC